MFESTHAALGLALTALFLTGCSQATDRPPAESVSGTTSTAPTPTATPADVLDDPEGAYDGPDGILDTPVPPKPGGP